MKCEKCRRMYLPPQDGPPPSVKKAIEMQKKANAMAAAEDALVAQEEEELRQAILISKREASEHAKQESARAKAEKKLREEEEKRIAEVDRMRENARKVRDADLVAKPKGRRGKVCITVGRVCSSYTGVVLKPGAEKYRASCGSYSRGRSETSG